MKAIESVVTAMKYMTEAIKLMEEYLPLKQENRDFLLSLRNMKPEDIDRISSIETVYLKNSKVMESLDKKLGRIIDSILKVLEDCDEHCSEYITMKNSCIQNKYMILLATIRTMTC